jgi:hypothetical protein
MRTPEQWFNDFPEPYRAEALQNLFEHLKSVEYESPDEALIDGFRWELTPQGHYYWQDFYEFLLETNFF